MEKTEITQQSYVLDIYNSLSNEDLEILLYYAKDRIFVFDSSNKTCSEVESICINGTQIQIDITS